MVLAWLRRAMHERNQRPTINCNKNNENNKESITFSGIAGPLGPLDVAVAAGAKVKDEVQESSGVESNTYGGAAVGKRRNAPNVKVNHNEDNRNDKK